ncbi:MAG: class I adenylate-forming enzyme family protein [Devosia sp.]
MLFENLQNIAARAPSSGLRADGRLHTYADLSERALAIAQTLSERGIGAGDAVAILLPNGPALFALVYALFALGAIALPLNIAAPPLELAAAMRRARPQALIGRRIGSIDLPQLARLYAPQGDLPVLFADDEGDDGILRGAKGASRSFRAPGADAVALYLFSSGSTGLPKVVPHTHGEMLANARATAHDFALMPDDVVFNNLPGHHAMGFLNSVFEVPQGGATTFNYSDPNSVLLTRGRLLEAVRTEGVTILPGVPFLFDALAAETAEHDLGRLRLVYSAGVSLKRPTYDKFLARWGFAIRQAYGCTEAGHVAFNRASDVSQSWDSVGRPVGDTVVEVVASEDSPDGKLGELAFRSSSLTKGYLGQGQLNDLAFAGGRFATGDLGRIDEDGNIIIKGRSKLIVEVAGHKVDPLEVEEVISQHPAVAEAVVVGVPDPRNGEQRLKMVVVKSSDTSPEALIRFCRERLAPQKVPAVVEFVETIPKSATGKILRGRLMEA